MDDSSVEGSDIIVDDGIFVDDDIVVDVDIIVDVDIAVDDSDDGSSEDGCPVEDWLGMVEVVEGLVGTADIEVVDVAEVGSLEGILLFIASKIIQ